MLSVVGRIVVALVVGLAALLVTSTEPHSGRVAGWFGTGAQPSLTFEVRVPSDLDAGTMAGLEAAWRRRLDGYGVRIAERGSLDLDLEVIGAERSDALAIAEALTASGRLEFRSVVHDTEVARALFKAVRSGEWPAIKAEIDGWRHDDSGRSYDDFYLYGPSVEELEAVIAEIQRRDLDALLPPDHEIAFEWVLPWADDDDPTPFVRTYVIAGPPVLDGSDVAEAMTVWDPQTNRPEVLVTFDEDGTRRFGEYTDQQTGQKMAIILNGEVRSAPVIQSAILGGRSNISMGGGSPEEQQADADALVAALQSQVILPDGIDARLTVVDEPSSTIRWGIRLGVAAAATLLAWLLAGLIARRTTLAPVLGGRTTVRADGVVVPALITVGLLVLTVILERIPLPWLADWVRDTEPDRAGLSIVALGITPVLGAFFVIEVIALLVPGWRIRRRGTPVERSPIDLAVVALSVGLAVLQAWFIAGYLQALGDDHSALSAGPPVRIAVTASLVGGVMLLAVIAGVISRAGLINGWLALFALGSARMLFDEVTAPAPPFGPDPGPLHLAIAGVAAVIAVGLVLRRAAPPDRRRLPLAGVAPLLLAPTVVGLLAIPHLAMLPGIEQAGRWLGTRSPWFDLAVAIAVAVAWSWPRRGRATSAAAVAISVAAVALLGLLPMLLPPDWRLWSYVVPAALIAVAVVELIAGVARRIRMPDAAVLIAVHDVDRADAIHDALVAAGIPAAQGGVLARGLLRFFGPYLPVVVHVPASRLDAAIAVISAPE